MTEGTATVQPSTVREFMHIITAQANAALANIERPGLLQISRLHPASETLVPSRFQLDDVERMIAAAITDCEAGHNVYIEGRTVREDLRGNARGKLADIAATPSRIGDKVSAPYVPCGVETVGFGVVAHLGTGWRFELALGETQNARRLAGQAVSRIVALARERAPCFGEGFGAQPNTCGASRPCACVHRDGVR